MVSERFIRLLDRLPEMSDRLQHVTENVTGNIVEIGGGEGVNTLRFLPVARRRKSTVIVVDPFEQIPGADESYFKPYTFEKFDANLKLHASDYLLDHLRLIELSSQHPEVPNHLERYKPIGFMFIDGLQDRASVYSDLKLAESLDVDVICVDDYDRLTESSEVPLAVAQFNMTTKYRFIDIGKREAYFIK